MKISAKTKLVLRLFHKYVGFIFSVFILHLTVTGILLLYPDFFGLNNKFISNPYVLKKYDMLSFEDVRKLGSKNDEILLLEDSLYFKGVFIDNFQNKIINALYQENNGFLAVFLEKQTNFYFLTEENNEINVYNVEEIFLEDKIINVGRNQDGKILIDTNSEQYIIKDKKLVATRYKSEIILVTNSKVEKNLAKVYLEIHQGKGVPLHRIVTELHNGKFMGSFLSYILLLSSISLLFLIFSSFFFGINIKRTAND
ncbi:MAG: hypothetical protein CFH34_01346 [Alphaproteobacteria bacterium MarineAlpha9_Bin4]|nr:hypothetical protein [Pelagibacterales bacterium]PPR25656.1 MAG: hypothetical protein CFH34_01346 [Alphaproteobacteria bacterium MarineAlpha9_Bin4]|tara:strand:+ start:367 stop:1131 length:765 start_codon:yes stop_codon:yes gene_type:complete